MAAPVLPASPPTTARAAEILRTGGLVSFPTETVYGLGAGALDERAVARVFEVKARPRFDPLIVHVAETRWLERLVMAFPPRAQKLAERFWPGPLTLVLPKTAEVPDVVTAGLPTVGVRIPDHPVALALLRAADLPVAAPSANLFGRISPTTAEHVREQLGERVDLILDGGPCRVGVESTVLAISDDGVTLLRPGGTSLEEIEAVVGRVMLARPIVSAGEARGLSSPGLLPQHYAPHTPLVLVAGEPLDRSAPGGSSHWLTSSQWHPGSGSKKVGLLALRPPADPRRFAAVEALSPAGDLREAAARFFAALRRLDAAGLDLIVAETFPEQGLGRALNDRLRRAAGRRSS